MEAGIEAAGRGAAAGIRRACLAAAGALRAVRPEAGRFPPVLPILSFTIDIFGMARRRGEKTPHASQ